MIVEVNLQLGLLLTCGVFLCKAFLKTLLSTKLVTSLRKFTSQLKEATLQPLLNDQVKLQSFKEKKNSSLHHCSI